MDYRESAKQVFELIGGKSNLISAAHCATRLRLVVADESVCKKGAIENVDGDVYKRQEQTGGKVVAAGIGGQAHVFAVLGHILF